MMARAATMPEVAIAPFSAAAVAAYAAASGDSNPLHIDSEVARAAGFSAPPVHGMLLMAAIEPALSAWAPDWRLKRLSGQFVEPLLVGESARLSARVVRAEGDTALLRVSVQGPRRAPCLIGEALIARKGA